MNLTNRGRSALAGAFAFVLAMSGNVAAQESLRPGAWALQFGISGNFTLSSFDGAGIALKRHFSSSSSLRAGMNLRRESGSTTNALDTLQARTEVESHLVRLSLQYLWYPRPQAELALFLGAGPTFDLSAADRTNVSPDGTTASTETSSWGAGATGVVGVEWFVQSFLGIHAEYVVSGGYISTEATSSHSSGPQSRTDLTIWNIGFDTVNFGISFYF